MPLFAALARLLPALLALPDLDEMPDANLDPAEDPADRAPPSPDLNPLTAAEAAALAALPAAPTPDLIPAAN